MQKYHRLWVVIPGAELEKRQCSAELVFTPEDDNLRVAIVFRGTGRSISNDDINCYHKSANVYWQQSARGDTKVCIDWAKNTFTPAMKEKQDYILFCCNLEG